MKAAIFFILVVLSMLFCTALIVFGIASFSFGLANAAFCLINTAERGRLQVSSKGEL